MRRAKVFLWVYMFASLLSATLLLTTAYKQVVSMEVPSSFPILSNQNSISNNVAIFSS